MGSIISFYAKEDGPTDIADDDIYLWEILVPTEMVNDHGSLRPIKTRFHRVWDQKVKNITGGLTIMAPAKGIWVNDEEDGKEYRERMIPVKIMCSLDQIEMIASMTRKYYKQKAVLFYRVSDYVRII